MKKGEVYGGELIWFICPSLYGKPVYDSKGEFIKYTINVPRFASITANDLVANNRRIK